MKKIFTNLFLLATLFLASANLSAQTYNGGTWYSLYDAAERTLKTSTWFENKEIYNYTGVLAPSTGVLTFDTKMTKHLGVTNPDSYEISVNGTKVSVPEKQTSYLNRLVNVSTDATSVSFVYIFKSYNSERTLSIANVKLPLAQHILLADDNNVDFANQLVGEQPQAKVVNLRSFLSAGDITISSDNPAFRVGSADNTEALVWAVGANACASTNGAAGTPAGGGALGDINLYDVNIYFCPTNFGAQSGTVTISDGVNSVKVSVSGTAVKDPQTIMWDQDLTNINTTDNITLNATAETEVKYISSDSTIAYADGNQLVINKYGRFTLTAVAVESEKYDQAISTKDIAINAVQPTVSVWPTVEPIAYAQTLAADMLVGGGAEVDGYFDWNTELNQTLVPGTHNIPVRFTPANTNYYAPVDGTVAVTINKSEQSIVWNDNFENITVVDSIVLNASAQTEITYEVSDMELAYITENNVLYFLHGGTLLITAYAVENEYYLADTLVRELTILPSKPTILSWPTASDIVYGQSLGESVLTGGEATIEGTFDWVDPNEVFGAGIYAPYVRFTPDDLVSFKIVEQQVQIQISSAEQTIEWELTNLVIKLGDTLHLNATATSGLEIAYALDNDMYAKIEGNVLEALQVGTVVVTASQDGIYVDDFGDEYANYLPAEPVSYTITIVANDATTALEDVQSTISRARKIIRNGQMYIIRGEQTYDALGNLIR